MDEGHDAPLVPRAVSLVPEMQPQPPRQDAFLSLADIAKQFGRFTALSGVSLEVARGDLVTFLGPSGCGKTTLLRIIAGLETQDRGRIVQNGRDISRLPAVKRDYGIVFQSYALFPNLTINDNVGYGLVNRRAGRARIRSRVAELLALVGLARRGRQVSRPALRRAATADCARSRAGDVARPASARRAAIGTRCAGAGTAARRDPRAAAAPGRDDDHGHARSGRSAVDGRHGRGDEPRPHRAGRHAATDLPRTGFGVRRRLCRQGERAERGR